MSHKSKLPAGNDTPQAVPVVESVEDTAHMAATILLMDAINEVPGFVPPRVDKFPAEAILIAAHALIAKLDAMETTQLEALRELRKSVDFLATRDDSNAEVLEPTKRESEIIYRALEEDYIINHTAPGIDEMDAALRRFKRLAGF